MENTTLYRKRYIPEETVLLKDDRILYCDDEIMITKWDVLKPRADFQKGLSCYFLQKGYKVSKFLNAGGELVYYYCDIIDVDIQKNEYMFTDLLVDVMVYIDGRVKLLDLGELADALEQGLIDQEIVKKALWRLDSLLEILYSQDCGEFLNTYLEKAGVHYK